VICEILSQHNAPGQAPGTGVKVWQKRSGGSGPEETLNLVDYVILGEDGVFLSREWEGLAT